MRTYSIPITMTQEDLDGGLRADCEYCPFALAVKRALRPLGFSAEVFTDDTRVFLGPNRTVIAVEHPKSVSDWIRRFDHRALVDIHPTFMLEIPLIEQYARFFNL
jgi:hypothetical protein